MKLTKIAFILGTRPEIIKMAPLIKAFQENSEKFNIIVIASGQHEELAKQAFLDFKVNVDIQISLSRKGNSLSELTAELLPKIDNVLKEVSPSWAFVHGDTTTTMVGAMAAYYQQINIVHVEAGLRTQNKHSPFPEEMNRRLVAQMADLHFTPTEADMQNLLDEGCSKETIYVTGNTIVDAVDTGLNMLGTKVTELLLDPNLKTVLVTSHRRETKDDALVDICLALKEMLAVQSDMQVVFIEPMLSHKKKIIREYLEDVKRMQIVAPMSYPDFIKLVQFAHLILSDSGGIQEEAHYLNIPLLILRENTERPIVLENKNCVLIGTKKEDLLKEINKTMEPEYIQACKKQNLHKTLSPSTTILKIFKQNI